MGIKVLIMKGEVYGKRDLSPPAGMDKTTGLVVKVILLVETFNKGGKPDAFKRK
jgi:small subunit ribosomal protein S3